jgi:hypothetical protein
MNTRIISAIIAYVLVAAFAVALVWFFVWRNTSEAPPYNCPPPHEYEAEIYDDECNE